VVEVSLGKTILVEANAWDVDGSVVQVEFFADESQIGQDDVGTDGWQTDWQDYTEGQHMLTARATDDDEATTISPAVAVEIEVEGPAPP